MYIAIRKYYIIPGRVDELLQRVREGFVPIISQVPGFVAYYLLEVGNDVVVSISIFKSRAGAEESTRQAAGWVEKNIASLIQGLPEITVGGVRVFSAGKGDKG